MTGSSWKSYLDPQIATRNRWADRHYARPGEVAEARTSRMSGAGNRGLAVAAAVALAVVIFFLVALNSSVSQPVYTNAPAAHPAPAASGEHSTMADAAGHATPTDSIGGGGNGHALAQ